MDLSPYLLASAGLLLIAYACVRRTDRRHTILRIFTMLPVCVLVASIGYHAAQESIYPAASTEHYAVVGSEKSPVTYEGTEGDCYLFSGADLPAEKALAVPQALIQLPVGADEPGAKVRLYYLKDARLEGVGSVIEAGEKTYAVTDAVAAAAPITDQTVAASAVAVMLLIGFAVLWAVVLVWDLVRKKRRGPAAAARKKTAANQEVEPDENAPWPLRLAALWRHIRKKVGLTAVVLAAAVLIFYAFATPELRDGSRKGRAGSWGVAPATAGSPSP